MYNPNAMGASANSYNNRLFVYEVEGLGSQMGRSVDFAASKSGRVTITVPYSRMNQEMQRVIRLGGKIVNIRPVAVDE